MLIYVYRHCNVDCSNGGVSSKYNYLWVRLPSYTADIKPLNGIPVMKLERHQPGCLRLVPEGEKRWVMFGGNYGTTSDSRFSQACEQLLGHRFYGAVAIHDRIE